MNKKKATIDFPKSAFKRKKKVEEGGTLGFKMKREQESTNLKAQNVMRGRMEPFVMPIVVRAMLTVV